jgi:hypothetical protein
VFCFFLPFVRNRVVLFCGLVAERQYNPPSSSSGTAHGPDQPVCTLAVAERGTGVAGPTRTMADLTPTTSPAKSLQGEGLAVMDSVVVAIPARCASVGDSTSPPVE